MSTALQAKRTTHEQHVRPNSIEYHHDLRTRDLFHEETSYYNTVSQTNKGRARAINTIKTFMNNEYDPTWYAIQGHIILFKCDRDG